MDKIALTTSTFAEHDTSPVELLGKKFELVRNNTGRKLKKEEILRLCSGCIGIIAGTELYDSDVLRKLSGLRVISRCGTGTGNINLKEAFLLGIRVVNTPDAATFAVAELTLGIILNLLRKVNTMDRLIRLGQWKKMTGNLLNDKKVGIVGFGRIGKKVAELLSPFGCSIAYFDPCQAATKIARRMNLKELLGWSDIVSLHVTGGKGIIGEKEIKGMKKGAWLINTSRGEIVDETALYNALREGQLSGAACDVYEKEPYDGPLKELDNVILTPHIGSYARESRIQMELEAVSNLLKKLEGEE
ncbi:MAG: phosphoglycerate dehydrogenase [Candidatus Omnitrophica bacterium]|nr:phosphoglycerate dehydrogenase [Candidatus Omnitrophota bacterium]